MNIEVKVIAGARKQEMKLEGSRLKVKLLAKPIKGKANQELIDFMAETFMVKKREVTIIAGERDTRKIVSIPIEEDRLKDILEGRQRLGR